jgi:Ni,Fe-hydrogenase III small subunit
MRSHHHRADAHHTSQLTRIRETVPTPRDIVNLGQISRDDLDRSLDIVTSALTDTTSSDLEVPGLPTSALKMLATLLDSITTGDSTPTATIYRVAVTDTEPGSVEHDDTADRFSASASHDHE